MYQRLPGLPTAPAYRPASDPSRFARAERPPMTDPIDLLIVDDSKADRTLVRNLLARPYRVREAATAREARALLRADEPDLVLLDYRLPDADGVDLLRAFVERHVPVVMLTGMEAPEVIVEVMREGAHDYLTKGRLTEDGLERAIANAVEKAALRRALDAQQRALAEHAAALEARNREVRALASALTLAEQAERRRVADLLHDNVQQMLFGVKLALRLLHAPAADPDAARKRLADAEDRRARLAALKSAIGATSPEDAARHARETEDWESTELADAS